MYKCKSDVFRGDIITIDGRHYIVVDSMNSNNGNFKAKDSRGRLTWFNTRNIDRVDKRKDQTAVYI